MKIKGSSIGTKGKGLTNLEELSVDFVQKNLNITWKLSNMNVLVRNNCQKNYNNIYMISLYIINQNIDNK